MYQTIYDSPWLVTFAVSVIAFVGLGLWLRRGPFLTAFLALFTIEILGDALRSGDWSPLHLMSISEFIENPISLLFVMVGDLRYFLLIERFAWRPQAKPGDATAPVAVLATLLTSLIVPLGVVAGQQLWPIFQQGQPLYLLWEGLFITVALVYRLVLLPRRLAPVPAPVRRWLFAITDFEIFQYALWIAADLIIMVAGKDWGYALRIVPNFLYYAFFLLFVAWRAPPEVSGAKS